MLSEEKILENKNRFLDLVTSIKIDGMLTDQLIAFLNKSDFFEAPASTQYHCSYKGGLCEHTLHVYDNLVKLANDYAPGKYSDDTLKIVSLFHDISKVNFYELYMRNVNTGTKNEKGKDIWIQVPEYRVRSVEGRFVGADHGTNSYIITSRYIPLSEEELIAICNHHCGFDNNFANKDLSAILDRYPLATLLHMADFLSTYIDERIEQI